MTGLGLQASPLAHLALLFHLQRLNVPDAFRILVNAAIGGEEAHPSHTRDALGHPLVLVLVGLVDEILCLEVGVEIV